MAKKKKKQKIKIYFRDGKKDIIPQKLWTDYDFIAKDSGTYGAVATDATLTPPPCVMRYWLERGQEDPTKVDVNNANTVVAVCRPDLGALSVSSGGDS